MNKCVLICDDDDGILDVAATVIESEGYKVIKVIDSTNIFEKIGEELPSLIFIDLWMPMLSGDQIVRKLKADNNYAQIPVIVISASPEGEVIAREAGAEGFLPKPFDIFDLVKLVDQYTGQVIE